MGASTFTTRVTGTSAKEAFDKARDQAAHQHGHGGYTGSIAEKDQFVMIHHGPMDHETAMAMALDLLNKGDPRVSDKWGPAGCIAMGSYTFLFFGWASE